MEDDNLLSKNKSICRLTAMRLTVVCFIDAKVCFQERIETELFGFDQAYVKVNHL